MIPSLENLKELEILIRFDCSRPSMSEITLNIFIDEHKNSREFKNLRESSLACTWESP